MKDDPPIRLPVSIRGPVEALARLPWRPSLVVVVVVVLAAEDGDSIGSGLG